MDEAQAHLRAVALAVAGMMLLLMVLKRYARRRGLATLGQSPLRRRREREAASMPSPAAALHDVDAAPAAHADPGVEAPR